MAKAKQEAAPEGSNNLPAAPVNTGVVTMATGRSFKVAKQVTFPLLKQAEGDIVNVQITGEVHLGKEIKGTKDGSGGVNMAPAKICHVIDLADGRPKQYIVPAVLEGVFNDEYPNHSYVGKYFSISKRPADPGKRYKQFEILEIEPTNEGEE